MTFDAVIIGAGMSGFAAGIRLAHYDKKVCILDRHTVWGGLNSFYKKGGRQLDVGLHAMTNFARKGAKQGPLPKVCRQLRLDIDAFQLLEQKHSLIRFPSTTLRFTNDVEVLTDEIRTHFPKEQVGFDKLCSLVRNHDDGELNREYVSARKVLNEVISSSLLINMIMCPLLFYGSATERDMDWNQFVIMFKAVFFEGFSRPHRGVRVILKKLRETFLERGGELQMGVGVKRLQPLGEGGVAVHLENGDTLRADKVLSSAGLAETRTLLGQIPDPDNQIGRMSFVETIFCLDCQPQELDINASITFFSHQDDFKYERCEDLVDFTSGIFCSPNNFQDDQAFDEGLVRLTNIANYSKWKALQVSGQEAYDKAKQKYIGQQLECLETVVPSFRSHISFTDSFTPVTIEKYTSHYQGAVYGSQVKSLTGEMGEKDVFLCGTDQGYLGIVGAMLSGILMANRHVLH